VGVDVGEAVGDAVGDAVGEAVGDAVGEAVGVAVGVASGSPQLPRIIPKIIISAIEMIKSFFIVSSLLKVCENRFLSVFYLKTHLLMNELFRTITAHSSESSSDIHEIALLPLRNLVTLDHLESR
jgi:hypothetical protein